MKNLLAYLCGAVVIACLVVTFTSATAAAEEDKGERTIAIADGKLKLQAPASWKRKKPQSAIVEHEFAVPASAGDSPDGRVTVMGAGGSVEANVDRWIGQFTQPDGGSTKQRAKTKKIKAAGEEVHMVDISGTFKDQLGPFAPAVERPKYRMLSAIITTKKSGNYFVKFYGPERTVAENEKAFVTMIEGMTR